MLNCYLYKRQRTRLSPLNWWELSMPTQQPKRSTSADDTSQKIERAIYWALGVVIPKQA